MVYDILGPEGVGPEGLGKLFRNKRSLTEEKIKIIKLISERTDNPLTRADILRHAGMTEADISKKKPRKYRAKL